MLLYYAFEIRAYGWYIFFAVAFHVCIYGKTVETVCRLVTLLGLYTHTYMVIVPAMQVLHYLFIEKNFART